MPGNVTGRWGGNTDERRLGYRHMTDAGIKFILCSKLKDNQHLLGPQLGGAAVIASKRELAMFVAQVRHITSCLFSVFSYSVSVADEHSISEL